MFVGKLGLLENKFQKTLEMLAIWDYFMQVIHIDSPTYKRIINLKENDKNTIDLKNGITAIEQCYQTKSPKDAFFESHIQMVDFQFVLEGKEIFFVAPRNSCVPKDLPQSKKEANLKCDLIEYNPCPLASSILLFDGMLAIFEKDDVHAGGIIFNEVSLIKKVVIKVPQHYLQLNF